ncbi:hypothetical protein [Roseateles sp. P5_E11]
MNELKHFNPSALIAPQCLSDCKSILSELNAELDLLIGYFSELRCEDKQGAEATV